MIRFLYGTLQGDRPSILLNLLMVVLILVMVL